MGHFIDYMSTFVKWFELRKPFFAGKHDDVVMTHETVSLCRHLAPHKNNKQTMQNSKRLVLIEKPPNQ